MAAPIILVLDDFHEVTDAGVVETFARFIDHQPPTVRLVVLSRSDPVLRLHRLRVSEQLTEIRSSDLAFTERETAQLLVVSGIDLDAGQVSILQERTQGWPAGVRLAAMSLDPDNVAAGIERFSGSQHAVADYLVGEVTAKLSAADRDFLLRTSVVERISGDLADHLTGRSDSQLILEGFVRENAFVVGLGGRREWFRYHPLLRELLRHRLRSEDPSATPELHRAAAEWMAAHDEPIEAIRQFLLAGDRVDAGRLLLSVLPKILSPQGPELAVAIEPLARTAHETPTLSSLLASATCHWHSGAPAAMLQDATDARRFLPEAAEDVRPAAEAAILLFELGAARISGDSAGVVDIASSVIDVLDQAPPQHLPGGRLMRIITMSNLGGAMVWTGPLDRAEELLEAVQSEAVERGLLLPHLNCSGHLALVDTFRGQFRRGHRRATDALHIIERRGWASEMQSLTTYLSLSQIALARDQLDVAETVIRKGLGVSGQHTDRSSRLALAIAAVQLAVSAGAIADAVSADAQVTAGLARTSHPADLLVRWSNVSGADAMLLDRRPAEAIGRIGTPGTVDGFASCWERVTLARAHIALGQFPVAADLIEPLLRPGVPFREPVISAQLLGAVIAQRNMHESQAMNALTVGLGLAVPEDIIRPFLRLGDLLNGHLKRYQQLDGPHRAFVTRLLDATDSPTPDGTAWTVTEKLTERENTVLHYLPTMLKAGEIGADLYLSVNTVKAHLRSIYRKLDVVSRREAVERARAVGLL